jgi:hypothetical protein
LLFIGLTTVFSANSAQFRTKSAVFNEASVILSSFPVSVLQFYPKITGFYSKIGVNLCFFALFPSIFIDGKWGKEVTFLVINDLQPFYQL